MVKHFLAFCGVLAATALLIGCGGKTDSRKTGTTDARIVGTWVAKDIHFGGNVQACPGEINASGQKVSCTSDQTLFSATGQYTVTTAVEDYFFDGTTLILYNRSGNGYQFGVTFDGPGNEMTWSFTQNGQPAQLIVDRVP